MGSVRLTLDQAIARAVTLIGHDQLTAAGDLLGQILGARPDHPDGLHLLGLVRQREGDFAAAQALIEKAIAAAPTTLVFRSNLAKLLHQSRRLEDAVKAYQDVLALSPDDPGAFANLCRCRQQLCDWQDHDALMARLDEMTEQALAEGRRPGETPFYNVVRRSDPRFNFRVATAWARSVSAGVVPMAPPSKRPEASHRPLRLGYVSADFQDHATAYLTAGLFSAHDRTKVTVFAYSHGTDDGGATRKRIETGVESFRDLRGRTDRQAAEIIRGDRIDVLVDLKGHSGGQRLKIFAYRPAPVQASYLVFPGTTGATFIDYIIADKTILPEVEVDCFSEAPIWLPRCYQANDGLDERKLRVRRSDWGLPPVTFVFAHLGNPYKIDPVRFSSWMTLLRSVPDSCLWLFRDHDAVEKNLRAAAQQSGVRPDRLHFCGRTDHDRHLKRIGLADVALDTRICNGHTTVSDALRAGVPVVTTRGDHFASRVAESLLTEIGASELIVGDEAEYVAMAKRLADRPHALKAMRARIWEGRQKSRLFDPRDIASSLEEAYRLAFARFQADRQPAPLSLD